LTRSHNPTELHPVLPWQHTPVPFFSFFSFWSFFFFCLQSKKKAQEHTKKHGRNSRRRTSVYKKKNSKLKEELLMRGQVVRIIATDKYKKKGHADISEAARFLEQQRMFSFSYISPALISQGLIKPSGFFFSSLQQNARN